MTTLPFHLARSRGTLKTTSSVESFAIERSRATRRERALVARISGSATGTQTEVRRHDDPEDTTPKSSIQPGPPDHERSKPRRKWRTRVDLETSRRFDTAPGRVAVR